MLISNMTRFAFFASFLLATSAFAQQKTTPTQAAAKSGKATIAGVVLDSLNHRYLSDAEVIVQGAKAALTTDSIGRFQFDSLPPGDYQVGVFHPVLDTLGLSLATKPFHVGPDSVSYVVLAVPSAASIIRTSCKVRPRSQGASAIIGRVEDPETLQPISGAEVSLAWSEVEVSKEIGVRQTPRLVRDTTDASGAYYLCGLPNSLQATLQARRGKSVTAEVPVSLGEADVELLARTLSLSPVDSGTKTGKASVSGRVILEGGPVGAGSRVELVGTEVVTVTNEKGEFTLNNLPSGTHVLMARHIGYGAETVPVDLTSRQAKNVTIKLPKYVAMMDPVLVTARRNLSLDRVGFSRRQKGGTGYFLGPDRIEKMHANYITDILRHVPGLRVNYTPQGEVITSSRGSTSFNGNGCVTFYVDDMPWQSMQPGDVNSFVGGHEVMAVEVYQGPGTPPQYMYMGGNCTTVLLWTKAKIRN